MFVQKFNVVFEFLKVKVYGESFFLGYFHVWAHCVSFMILVMDMNFSILLQTSHASPGDGGGISGLGVISGLGTCVNLRTCSNIWKILHFSLYFRYDEFQFFQKWINWKHRYPSLKQKYMRFLEVLVTFYDYGIKFSHAL